MDSGYGRKDPSAGHAKQQLLGFMRRVRERRDARREINEDIAEIRKEARDAGFDAKRIEDVVRWQEECEKHGREVVDEAEAMFELYRSVADGGGRDFGEIVDDARDRALLKLFAPDDQLEPKAPTKKQRAAADALAGAAIARMNRGDV